MPRLRNSTDKNSESRNPKEEHLDSKQLAQRWAMSYRTLDRWRWQGQGPRFIKIGGRVVYRLKDIEEYEANNLHNNTIYEGTA